jgi:hypothetical protein
MRSVTFLFLGREIPSFFILEMRLVLGNPSRAAAPSGPPITQPVSSNARKIRDRVQSLNVPDVGLGVVAFWGDTGVRANTGGQRIGKHVVIRPDDGPFDQVLEFADISGPRVGSERSHCF